MASVGYAVMIMPGDAKGETQRRAGFKQDFTILAHAISELSRKGLAQQGRVGRASSLPVLRASVPAVLVIAKPKPCNARLEAALTGRLEACPTVRDMHCSIARLQAAHTAGR